MDGKVKVVYQGVAGAYTHTAAMNVFPNADEYIGVMTFEEVPQAVIDGRADYAIIPIENSTAGRVANVHLIVPKSGLFIQQEYFLPIRHQLIAKKGVKLEDVRKAYSLHQALAQSDKFLKEHGIEEVQFTDTAAAVKYISENGAPDEAAIASRESVEIYDGVEIIAEDINTNNDNVTRFLILGKEENNVTGIDDELLITSVFYKTKNIPSALYKSLAGFATAGINVIKLESFMPMTHTDDAGFYLEFVGGANSAHAKQALLELSHYAKDYRVIGTYKKHEFRIKNID